MHHVRDNFFPNLISVFKFQSNVPLRFSSYKYRRLLQDIWKKTQVKLGSTLLSILLQALKKTTKQLGFQSPTSYKIIPYRTSKIQPFEKHVSPPTTCGKNTPKKQKQRIFLMIFLHPWNIPHPKNPWTLQKNGGWLCFAGFWDLETSDLRKFSWFLGQKGTSFWTKSSTPGSGKRPKFRTISLRVDWIHFHHCNNDKIKAMLKTNPIKMMLAWGWQWDGVKDQKWRRGKIAPKGKDCLPLPWFFTDELAISFGEGRCFCCATKKWPLRIFPRQKKMLKPQSVHINMSCHQQKTPFSGVFVASLSHFGPWNKILNFTFTTKYVLPKSLKVGHWLSEFLSYFCPIPKKRKLPSPSLYVGKFR